MSEEKHPVIFVQCTFEKYKELQNEATSETASEFSDIVTTNVPNKEDKT